MNSKVARKDIIVSVCDLPKQHFFGEVSRKFYESLAFSQNLDLFNNEIIQAMIDYKWIETKRFTFNYLFFPFLLFLGAFIAYSNVFAG